MAEQIAATRGVVDPVAGPMSRLSALDAIAVEARSLDTVGGSCGKAQPPLWPDIPPLPATVSTQQPVP